MPLDDDFIYFTATVNGMNTFSFYLLRFKVEEKVIK